MKISFRAAFLAISAVAPFGIIAGLAMLFAGIFMVDARFIVSGALALIFGAIAIPIAIAWKHDSIEGSVSAKEVRLGEHKELPKREFRSGEWPG